MKMVVSDSSTGKSYQREVPKEQEGLLVGRKVGQKLEGGIIGLGGYELQITGGSSAAGFPMRGEIPGSKRMNALLSAPPGVRGLKKGQRKKKPVVGGVVAASTMQLNAKIVSKGPKSLEELGFVTKAKEGAAKEKEEKKVEAAKEKKVEEKKEETQKEAPKEEKKAAEAPKEEKKA